MQTSPSPLVLIRTDPARNMARFYRLSIEPTLFCAHALVLNWGRMGSHGRLRIEPCADESEARGRFERLASAKRRRGYRAVS